MARPTSQGSYLVENTFFTAPSSPPFFSARAKVPKQHEINIQQAATLQGSRCKVWGRVSSRMHWETTLSLCQYTTQCQVRGQYKSLRFPAIICIPNHQTTKSHHHPPQICSTASKPSTCLFLLLMSRATRAQIRLLQRCPTGCLATLQ